MPPSVPLLLQPASVLYVCSRELVPRRLKPSSSPPNALWFAPTMICGSPATSPSCSFPSVLPSSLPSSLCETAPSLQVPVHLRANYHLLHACLSLSLSLLISHPALIFIFAPEIFLNTVICIKTPLTKVHFVIRLV